MARSTINITSLPPELLHLIVSYIPTSSLISLKLASRHLFLATHAPAQGWIKTASSCERRAARRYVTERQDLACGRRQCTTCHLVASMDRFSLDVPVCKWHDQWFLSTTAPSYLEFPLRRRLADLARRTKRNAVRWIAIDRIYCAHTRDIIGWHVADCECTCNSCGHFPVKCYVRVSGKLGNPKYAELSEDKQSVSEERWVHVSGQPIRMIQDLAPVVMLEDT